MADADLPADPFGADDDATRVMQDGHRYFEALVEAGDKGGWNGIVQALEALSTPDLARVALHCAGRSLSERYGATWVLAADKREGTV